jgi:hypothetical protein
MNAPPRKREATLGGAANLGKLLEEDNREIFSATQARAVELLCFAVQSLHRIENELRKLQPPYWISRS